MRLYGYVPGINRFSRTPKQVSRPASPTLFERLLFWTPTGLLWVATRLPGTIPDILSLEYLAPSGATLRDDNLLQKTTMVAIMAVCELTTKALRMVSARFFGSVGPMKGTF